MSPYVCFHPKQLVRFFAEQNLRVIKVACGHRHAAALVGPAEDSDIEADLEAAEGVSDDEPNVTSDVASSEQPTRPPPIP